jgi:hypothetical protein
MSASTSNPRDSPNLGDRTRNEWDVRLSDRVPISLGLDLGAARGGGPGRSAVD